MAFIPVATIDEIPEGGGKCIEVGGREIALFCMGGHFYATSNVCPHQGGPLAEGKIEGEMVVCPWHQWRFNIKTGVSFASPKLKIEIYPVRREGNQIMIAIPE